MSASVQYRCTNCNQRFQASNAGACSVCAATAWEPCVVETVTTGIERTYLHPSGVAFFAYDEAAKVGVPIPAWAAAAIPANSAADRAKQLDSRLAAAITSNSTYLAIASPNTATNTAQVKSLTRQVQALLRKSQGRYDGLD